MPRKLLASGTIQLALEIAVDIGGTFTDFVIQRKDDIEAFKLPSTPFRPEDVLERGLRDLEISAMGHGTTIATNAVIEGRGAKTALLTTSGFEDILVIGRQNRPKLYDLKATRPQPLVPRELTFGLKERVDAEGRILRPLDLADVKALAEKLKALEVESVAVSLLFSFLNSRHEAQVAAILGQDLDVSYSSQVLPEFREYERTSTTVLDAFVGPMVRDYLRRLEAQVKAPLYIMRSNGGIREARTLSQRPIEMLLSGPAGGMAGSKILGEILGLKEIVALDMGGTSADISLLHDGQPLWTTDADIGGHPLALPVLDISTIGAGGGSVTWIDTGGALRVGPRSAGADPGPMCYARGGNEPTLTDANVVSGLLGESLGGGEIKLNSRLAKEGFVRLSQHLGLPLEDVIAGVRKVVVSNMVRATALAFAKRGMDPRDFMLVAFGGAGPMHAVEVARELGIPRVVVPPIPGAFSAYGILLSDLRLDYGRSLIRPLEGSAKEVESVWIDMEAEAARDLKPHSYQLEDALLLRSLDLRYRGQSYEINVPVSPDVESGFHALHDARFGYAMEGEPVEVVSVRLTTIVERPKSLPKIRGGPVDGQEGRTALMNEAWSEVPVYPRPQLPAGFTAEGPLIVEEETATTVLDPSAKLGVDEFGCLRIEVM